MPPYTIEDIDEEYNAGLLRALEVLALKKDTAYKEWKADNSSLIAEANRKLNAIGSTMRYNAGLLRALEVLALKKDTAYKEWKADNSSVIAEANRKLNAIGSTMRYDANQGD